MHRCVPSGFHPGHSTSDLAACLEFTTFRSKTGSATSNADKPQPNRRSLDFDGDDRVCGATVEKIKLGADGKPLDNSCGLDPERPRQTALLRVDPATGKVREFRALHYPVSSVAFSGGAYCLAEMPEMGYDRQDKPVRVYPKSMAIHRVIYSR